MSRTVLVVGDHDPANQTHTATELALRHAADDLGQSVEVIWMATDTISSDTAAQLAGVDAMVLAPGTPYRSLDGALAAIEVARTHGIPVLGTCGGMQHLVLEVARHVVGAAGAAHAERDPDAADPWITPLACSLAGRTDAVEVVAGSVAADAYRNDTPVESYYCSFGIDPSRLTDLAGAGLVATGIDRSGTVVIVELLGHPFFVGTLFVPQVQSRPDRPHPLVLGLLAAAIDDAAQ